MGSLHARLNCHCEAWSYKERKHKHIKADKKCFRKNPQAKDAC